MIAAGSGLIKRSLYQCIPDRLPIILFSQIEPNELDRIPGFDTVRRGGRIGIYVAGWKEIHLGKVIQCAGILYLFFDLGLIEV